LTSDGVVVRGVQIDRDDQRLILRNETGKEVVIPIDEIEQESEGKSLMPEGLHHLLTRDELVDLVSFLSVLGKPGDFAVNTRPTINRFDVAGDKEVDWAKVDDADLVAKSSGLPETSWQSVYSLVDGTIPGKDIVTMAATSGSILLRGTLDVVVAGTLAVRVNGTEPPRVVISGKRVDASDGVELAPGRYPVYVVLAPEFDAQDMVVELIKPSGSPIQFTVGGVK
jgi:hypothetical protein